MRGGKWKVMGPAEYSRVTVTGPQSRAVYHQYSQTCSCRAY